MCEIFLLQHNKKQLNFSKTAIEDAIDSNNDGCGYVIFEKNTKKNTFDLKQIEQINFEKIKARTTKRGKTIYLDYDLNDDNTITFYDYEGVISTFTLPKELHNLQNAAEEKKEKAIVDWTNEKSIAYDPLYNSIGQSELGFVDKYEDGFTYETNENTADSVDKAIDTLYKKQNELQINQFMIMHFRHATSGRTNANTQPIIYGNFLTIHNGIFTGLGDYDKSDTRIFTEKLDAEYNKQKPKTAKKEEILIREFLDKTEGWYSIFIYSWKTHKLYYFRKGANFYRAFGSNMYSTRESRFPVAYQEVNSLTL